MTQSRAPFKSDIRIRKDEAKPRQSRVRLCVIKDCTEPGECRVPKSRENLSDYVFLCIAHARAHNEAWDFFQGMDDQDIERFRDEAMFGHRPTWPLGRRAARARHGHGPYHFHDGHALLDDESENSQPRRPERQLTRLQATAMDTLQLAHNATLNEIKARYKELVKRFHPDANGGDRGAEERLKQVIKAYGVLRASGLV
ncbi:MAG: J domain-containing protein [Rhizomicrobium sp.]